MTVLFAVVALCAIVFGAVKSRRNELKKQWGKEYEVNFINGTYYITADRRKFESLYNVSIPSYRSSCYAHVKELWQMPDCSFDKKVHLVKYSIKLTTKALGKLLFKCKLRGIVFDYRFQEYEDFDIRQMCKSDEPILKE